MSEAWADTHHQGDVDMDGPDDYPDPPSDADPRAADDADPPQLYYLTLDAFVRDLLATTYRRPIDGRHRTWCPQWWRHAEAITRLEALWRSWPPPASWWNRCIVAGVPPLEGSRSETGAQTSSAAGAGGPHEEVGRR
jgi:hypothetical protein